MSLRENTFHVMHRCPSTMYDVFDRKGGEQQTTHYCPGCGHGNVHKLVAEAIEDLELQDRSIFVSPVGCSVFAYYYFDVGNIQVAHGRCPAAATAIKRAQPGALVIGYQGDGDLAAIGGNEILQAANRGENISIFFVNNAIYGMTGGQMAPTTVMGMRTTTTPDGREADNEGFPIRVCELLATLDAPYYLERVALGDPKHNHKARAAIRKALRYQVENRGFSLVEILSPCPTGWKMNPVDAAAWTVGKLAESFPLGVYRDGHERELGHPRERIEPDPARVPEILGLEAGAADLDLPDHAREAVDARVKISGFGGQGVILMGQILAHAGMLASRRVAWMPSYGPEMRGGTAHCHVTISGDEIGSPLVDHPTVLVAMNGPSIDRFGPDVVPGGTIVFNSSMIDDPAPPQGAMLVPVPVNAIADRLGSAKVGNMVMLGALLHLDGMPSKEAVLASMVKKIHADPELLELNRRALEAGMEAVGVSPVGAP